MVCWFLYDIIIDFYSILCIQCTHSLLVSVRYYVEYESVDRRGGINKAVSGDVASLLKGKTVSDYCCRGYGFPS